MALTARTIHHMRHHPDRLLRRLRASGEATGPLAPPTPAEAATMAIRGPWSLTEGIAVTAPWLLVLLGMVLMTFGSATVYLVLISQAVAALVTTSAVLYRRYSRRANGL